MRSFCLGKLCPSLFASILVAATAFAQKPGPVVIPPSPNAMAFQKYGDIPVSTYTGIPNIDIPIYTISVRDVKVPISLSYHASGIRVGEEASRVGLGWVLNSGGLISRNIINMDDFIVNPSGYLNSSNNAPFLPTGPNLFPKAYLQAGTILKFVNSLTGDLPPIDMTDYIYGSNFDYEPDQFNYNFQGMSGKFTFIRDAVAPHAIKAILDKQEKIQIVPATDGSMMTVTTPDGAKYTFAATEIFTDPSSITPGLTQISSWYLTQILSAEGETVTFTYTSLGSQYIRPIGSFTESQNGLDYPCSLFNCTPGTNSQGVVPRKNYSNIYLSTITWRTGKVEFETENREDITGDIRIKTVKIYSKTADTPATYLLFDQYVFNYDYFNYNVGSATYPMVDPDVTPDHLRKRLKLTSMVRQSADDPRVEKHSFTYYESSNQDQMPDKNSFARDHWGYYNGRNGNSSFIPSFKFVTVPITSVEMSGSIGPERNPSSIYMRAFSLKDITYPTAGKTTLTYGTNDYEIIAGDPMIPTEPYAAPTESFIYDAQAHMGTIQSTLLDLRAEYQSPSGYTTPIAVHAAFRAANPCSIGGTHNIYFQVTSEDGNTIFSNVSFNITHCGTAGQIDCLYCDPAQTTMGVWSYDGFLTVPPGKYYWKAFSATGETLFQDISASYTWWADPLKRSPLGPGVKYDVSGGLRVEQIDESDPESNSTIVKKYDYHYSADSDGDGIPEIHSYGKRATQPQYTYFDVAWQKQPNVVCLGCVHVRRSSDSYLPVTGNWGSPVGYSQVAEIFGANGENGKIVSEYQNSADQTWQVLYPFSNLSLWLRPAAVSSNPDPIRGMLNRKTTYTASGVPVSRTTNTWTTTYAQTVWAIQYFTIATSGFDMFDYVNADSSNGVTRSNFMMNVYPALQSKFNFLATALNEQFDAAGLTTLSSPTTYAYENQNHLQVTKVSKDLSNGHKQITKYKYPADYTDTDAGTIVGLMKNTMFIHNAKVEETTLDESESGTQRVVSQDITIYDQFGSYIFPKSVVSMKKNLSVKLSGWPVYKPAVGYDVTKFRQVLGFDYSTGGNISKTQRLSDMPVAYLWAYNETLPVAEIKNALPAQVFHTSFEDDNGALFTDVGSNNIARTGKRVWNSGSYTFPGTYTPVPGGTLMSYWYWQNSQWNYSGEVAWTATITSAGIKLDEVRAYPVGSQISTYSHEPVNGLTTVTDHNGQTSFYEYDFFARLKLVRDENKNILKTYDYSYKIR